MEYYFICHFFGGYFSWLVHKYYFDDQVRVKDLLDAIGFGLMGPLTLIMIGIIYIPIDKVIIRRKEKYDEKDDI